MSYMSLKGSDGSWRNLHLWLDEPGMVTNCKWTSKDKLHFIIDPAYRIFVWSIIRLLRKNPRVKNRMAYDFNGSFCDHYIHNSPFVTVLCLECNIKSCEDYIDPKHSTSHLEIVWRVSHFKIHDSLLIGVCFSSCRPYQQVGGMSGKIYEIVSLLIQGQSYTEQQNLISVNTLLYKASKILSAQSVYESGGFTVIMCFPITIWFNIFLFIIPDLGWKSWIRLEFNSPKCMYYFVRKYYNWWVEMCYLQVRCYYLFKTFLYANVSTHIVVRHISV